MKLHLGCFNQPVKGWYNTDITPHIFISRIPFAAHLLMYCGKMSKERLIEHRAGTFKKVHYLNLSKKFPFNNNSVEAIFSSHVIEHLSPSVAEYMLSESLRILKPNGICRVVAPSLEMAISNYDNNFPERMLKMIFEHNHTNPKNRHQWMYTGSSLIKLMLKLGFSNVEQWSFRKGNLPDLNLLDNRPKNSIYVEGTKV